MPHFPSIADSAADSTRVRPGNEEARFMDHIAASLAATEEALADLEANPVVPPRRLAEAMGQEPQTLTGLTRPDGSPVAMPVAPGPRGPRATTRPNPAAQTWVDSIAQANQEHRRQVALTNPIPERKPNAMTNREMKTAPDGKKYLHAWDMGVYRITLTIPYSPTVGQWSVTMPDGRVLPTPIDGKDNKWYVADTRVKNLTAAIDMVVARDAAVTRAEAVAPVASPVAEGTTTPASVVAIEAAEAIRQEVIEAAETAEEAAQVQTEARTTRPSRRRSTNNRSPLEADRGPKPPAQSTLRRWARDGIAKATDGCRVEPDGRCEHGKPSWLLELGLI